MNPEVMNQARIEQLLQDNLELAEENNRILRDVRRAMYAGFWFRVVIWAIIIILPFLLLKPILNTLVPGVSSSESGVNFFGFPSQEDIERAIDSYQGGQ